MKQSKFLLSLFVIFMTAKILIASAKVSGMWEVLRVID